jgi:hypothetical protein
MLHRPRYTREMEEKYIPNTLRQLKLDCRLFRMQHYGGVCDAPTNADNALSGGSKLARTLDNAKKSHLVRKFLSFFERLTEPHRARRRSQKIDTSLTETVEPRLEHDILFYESNGSRSMQTLLRSLEVHNTADELVSAHEWSKDVARRIRHVLEHLPEDVRRSRIPEQVSELLDDELRYTKSEVARILEQLWSIPLFRSGYLELSKSSVYSTNTECIERCVFFFFR